mgnify:CR=1 FL=1
MLSRCWPTFAPSRRTNWVLHGATTEFERLGGTLARHQGAGFANRLDSRKGFGDERALVGVG